MLKINRVFLEGKDKNYTVLFYNGLNIIYGDSDKGKTTILELIKYALGGEKFKVNKEIQEKVKRFFLEIEINQELMVIERDLFNNSNYIKVYFNKIEEIDSKSQVNYFSIEKDLDLKNFSEFLLEKMGIKLGRIPKKYKNKTIFQTITLPSIMKFCYLTQDDIGSKKLLNLDNYGWHGINIKILKYIYGVLDDEIAILEKEKADIALDKNNKDKECTIINEFFTDDNIKQKKEIEEEIKLLLKIIEEKEKEKEIIDEEIIKDTYFLENIRVELNKNYIKERENQLEINNLKSQNKKFKKLLEEYINEIKKIDLGIKLLKHTDLKVDLDMKCSCPLCKNIITLEEIEENYEIEKKEYLEIEKKNIEIKYISLNKYLEEVSLKIDKLSKENIEVKLEIKELESIINKEIEKSISPFLSVRDKLNENIGRNKEKIQSYSMFLKIREKIENKKIEIQCLEEQIREKNKEIEEKKDKNVSSEEVKESLRIKLENILKNIEIENPTGIGINERFMPILRGESYENHTSGGVRTILSVGYFLSMLEDTISKKLNRPSLLLIDTIGNFLGKNKENDDGYDIVNDPKKHKNMYREILRICSLAEGKGKDMQVIVVDNDYPGKEYETYIRKKFGKEKGYECGLINDYNSF